MSEHEVGARDRTITRCALWICAVSIAACGEASGDEGHLQYDGAVRPGQGLDAGLATDSGASGDASATFHDGAARDDAETSAPSDAQAGSDARLLDGGATPGDATRDDILGQAVPRSDAWWVENGRIHFGEREVALYGLNWFGLETEARALFGPQEAGRSVADFLAQIKALGFNALRVPLSPESIDPGYPTPAWATRGALDTGRKHFEELAQAAKDAGIYMLWDIHTCSSAVGYRKLSPLDPACVNYGRTAWIDNLKTLAQLANNYAPYVVGIDLFNEPHGLTWPAWKQLAEEGGRAVLRENPRILTFVEGVGGEGYQHADGVFWGENLTGAREAPVDLPASRLVYSPHVYGPSVYVQPYFGVANFPDNMPAIWDRHFGFLMDQNQAVVLGEFGGRYVNDDKVWQDRFVAYLRAKSSRSFFFWCLNPNSDDTGGLLMDDWRTVHQGKLSLLQQLMQ